MNNNDGLIQNNKQTEQNKIVWIFLEHEFLSVTFKWLNLFSIIMAKST